MLGKKSQEAIQIAECFVFVLTCTIESSIQDLTTTWTSWHHRKRFVGNKRRRSSGYEELRMKQMNFPMPLFCIQFLVPYLLFFTTMLPRILILQNNTLVEVAHLNSIFGILKFSFLSAAFTVLNPNPTDLEGAFFKTKGRAAFDDLQALDDTY